MGTQGQQQASRQPVVSVKQPKNGSSNDGARKLDACIMCGLVVSAALACTNALGWAPPSTVVCGGVFGADDAPVVVVMGGVVDDIRGEGEERIERLERLDPSENVRVVGGVKQ